MNPADECFSAVALNLKRTLFFVDHLSIRVPRSLEPSAGVSESPDADNIAKEKW
jgi:hypothetical protein